MQCLLHLLLILSWTDSTRSSEATPFSVVGYVPEWRFDGIPFESISPHLTHLILFSVETDVNADIVELERLLSPEKMKEIRFITKQSDTLLLISFGGYGRSNGFPVISISESLRLQFVNNVISLMDLYDLDGIDLNWEYPSNEEEWIGLFQIIQLLKLQRPQQVITMAFYPGQEQVITSFIASRYDLLENVSLFLSMTYDNIRRSERKHSTFDFAVESIENAINRGIPSSSLCLGLPFYARSMRTGDWKTYEEIVREWREEEEGNVLRDEKAIMAFKSRDIWKEWYYNSYDTISKKTRLAMESHLGGVMIWENGQDVHEDNLSLMRAITETILLYGGLREGHEEL